MECKHEAFRQGTTYWLVQLKEYSWVLCFNSHTKLSKVKVSKFDDTEFEIKNKHCKIAVDDAIGKKWSDISDMKSEMVEQTCVFCTKLSLFELKFCTFN